MILWDTERWSWCRESDRLEPLTENIVKDRIRAMWDSCGVIEELLVDTMAYFIYGAPDVQRLKLTLPQTYLAAASVRSDKDAEAIG